MEVLLKVNAKKFGEFSGKWYPVETEHLFNNQYNTPAPLNLRIMDSDIQAVRDDARAGLGVCRYCGKMVKNGEAEAHYQAEELKPCDGCFWWSWETLTEKSESLPAEVFETINPDGTKHTITKTHRMCETTKERKCTHKEKHGGCTHDGCRKLGVEPFTENNTFFLAYPNGINHGEPVNPDFSALGFDVETWRKELKEKNWAELKHKESRKKLGSYTLRASFTTPGEFMYFVLENGRNKVIFNIDNESGKYLVYKWDTIKTADKLPDVISQTQAELNKIFFNK